jgi:hypothetical protein
MDRHRVRADLRFAPALWWPGRGPGRPSPGIARRTCRLRCDLTRRRTRSDVVGVDPGPIFPRSERGVRRAPSPGHYHRPLLRRPGPYQGTGDFQGATAAGASAGIVLGGILTEFVGWRSVFLVNPPVIVGLVIAIRRVLPTQTRRARARLDVAGAVLATASTALLIFGLSQGQQHGFITAGALTALVVSVGLGVRFVVVEKRIKNPMVPLRVLADPARRAALSTMLLLGAVVAATSTSFRSTCKTSFISARFRPGWPSSLQPGR